MRGLFNAEYGGHLPEDICLYIENMPTKWQVIPWEGDRLESLPEVPEDLITEVCFFPSTLYEPRPIQSTGAREGRVCRYSESLSCLGEWMVPNT